MVAVNVTTVKSPATLVERPGAAGVGTRFAADLGSASLASRGGGYMDKRAAQQLRTAVHHRYRWRACARFWGVRMRLI
jgi:hypothetical protein